jgi:hypothetical protein
MNETGLNAITIIGFIVGIIAFCFVIYGLTKRRYRLISQIGLMLAAIALAGPFAAYRFKRAGLWFPKMPDNVRNWRATQMPVSKDQMAMLGNPMADARMYMNPFGEIVESSMVCAGPFENYHDPTVCVVNQGFVMTAKKTMPLGVGNAQVRAMIFKSTRVENVRILMYYWTQTRDGEVATEARMGNYRDMLARFNTGYDAVVRGKQVVIVRNYAILRPDDPNGMQAQYNLTEISRETYKALKADGEAKKS